MNNEDKLSITEAIVGNSDYQIYNRESCLKGKPLKKLRESIALFNNNQLDINQFLQDALIAYRLHLMQIPIEIQQVIAEKKDKDEKKEYNPINPQEWSNTLTKEQLVSSAQLLVTMLGEAIKKAKEKVLPPGGR